MPERSPGRRPEKIAGLQDTKLSKPSAEDMTRSEFKSLEARLEREKRAVDRSLDAVDEELSLSEPIFVRRHTKTPLPYPRE